MVDGSPWEKEAKERSSYAAVSRIAEKGEILHSKKTQMYQTSSPFLLLSFFCGKRAFNLVGKGLWPLFYGSKDQQKNRLHLGEGLQ